MSSTNAQNRFDKIKIFNITIIQNKFGFCDFGIWLSDLIINFMVTNGNQGLILEKMLGEVRRFLGELLL